MPQKLNDTDRVTASPFAGLLMQYQTWATLTNAELANRARLTARAVQLYVGGVEIPRNKTLERLCRALDLENHDRDVLFAFAQYARQGGGMTAQTTDPSDPAARPSRSFGELLAHYRMLTGITLPQVASAVGITPQHLRRLEDNQRRPSMLVLRNLGQSLALSEHDRRILAAAAVGLPPPPTVPGLPVPPIYDDEVPSLVGVGTLEGRADDLAEVKRRLMLTAPARLALVGLPGVGKTTLAAALAHDHAIRERFMDGVLWARLGRGAETTHHLVRWASLLGVSLADDQAIPPMRWRRIVHHAIGSRRVLVILDDAWDAKDVEALYSSGTECAMLITTRSPAIAQAIAGRAVYALAPLGHDDGLTLLHRVAPALARSESVEVRGLKAELVVRVDGLPLALTMIGKHIQMQCDAHASARTRQRPGRLSLRDTITEQLRKALLELAPDANEMPGQRESLGNVTQVDPLTGLPTSLRQVIEVSVRALDDAAGVALRALGAFPGKPGTFSRAAALHVGAVNEQALDALVNAGLLEIAAEGRYAMHGSIREYARMHAMLEPAERRLVGYYARFAEQPNTSIAAAGEQLNLLGALAIASKREWHGELVRLIMASAKQLQASGLHHLVETYLVQAEQAVRGKGDIQALMRILDFRASNLDRSGKSGMARALLQEALALASERGERGAMAALLAELGAVTNKTGNFAEADTILQRGQAIAEHLGLRAVLCDCLQHRSGTAMAQGHHKLARDLAHKGLSIARALNDRERESGLLSAMGNVLSNLGRCEQAYDHLLRCAELSDSLDLKIRLGYVLTNLGTVAINLGRFGDAEQHLNRALHLGEQLQHDLRIAMARANLAQVKMAHGNNEAAEHDLHQTLDVLGGSTRIDRLVDAYLWLSILETSRGRFKEARRCIREGQRVMQANPYPEFQARLLLSEAECDLREGMDEVAKQHVAQAQAILAGDAHLPELESIAHGVLGQLALRRNDVDGAAREFEAALDAAGEYGVLTAEALFGLAQTAAARGNLETARATAAQSLARFTAMGHRRARAVQMWLARLS